MANKIFSLDVISPAEATMRTISENGWVIAVAALLVIGAIVGIIIFNKNKKSKK